MTSTNGMIPLDGLNPGLYTVVLTSGLAAMTQSLVVTE